MQTDTKTVLQGDILEQREAKLPAVRPPRSRTVAAPVQAQPTTPMDLLRIVTERGAPPEEISKFMDLMERQRKAEAEQAFLQARAAFTAETIVITKDKENKQFGSHYTTIGNLVSTVTPFLSKHSLSASWKIKQDPGNIEVTCVLSHSMGHSDSVSFTVPPDTSGSKNVIQQIKSSITYAKSVTFESVCGIAATDANLDDDGNAAGEMRQMAAAMKKSSEQAPAKHKIDAPTLKRALAAIKAGDYTYGELAAYYGLTAEQDAHARLELGMEAAQ